MTTNAKPVVHGVQVERFVKTGRQDGKDVGYILVFWGGNWVTGWYKDGQSEWAHGNYFGSSETEKEKALNDLYKRVADKTR
jgi:hypothetical protein